MNADSVRAAISAALLTDAEFALPIEEWWTTFENPFKLLIPDQGEDDDEDDDNDEDSDHEDDEDDDDDDDDDGDDDDSEAEDDSAGEKKPDGDAGDEEEGGGDEGTLYRTVIRVVRKAFGVPVTDASH
jgi:hypothetical protein